jgi:hypothetical protein
MAWYRDSFTFFTFTLFGDKIKEDDFFWAGMEDVRMVENS